MRDFDAFDEASKDLFETLLGGGEETGPQGGNSGGVGASYDNTRTSLWSADNRVGARIKGALIFETRIQKRAFKSNEDSHNGNGGTGNGSDDGSSNTGDINLILG